jgi:hypothetical protein
LIELGQKGGSSKKCQWYKPGKGIWQFH